ncbi:hypothetical protein ANCDUO_00166 [Ancylostoma duodenale]|uniref:Uncharacterized protein n=1 Tax=Ancylostoma duodenale TaxID=51022 RepID=A0A0C2E244_9BILA|nr:hypothetical protein ANCDUO_00166 [Ancylostoma duodenale]
MEWKGVRDACQESVLVDESETSTKSLLLDAQRARQEGKKPIQLDGYGEGENCCLDWKDKRALRFSDDVYRQPRNPYSWMYTMFDKRARNPYSWMNE